MVRSARLRASGGFLPGTIPVCTESCRRRLVVVVERGDATYIEQQQGFCGEHDNEPVVVKCLCDFLGVIHWASHLSLSTISARCIPFVSLDSKGRTIRTIT